MSTFHLVVMFIRLYYYHADCCRQWVAAAAAGESMTEIAA